MQDENILLTPDELAEVTGGYWENLPDAGLDIKYINFRLGGIKPGYLHVTYNDVDWPGWGSSESKLDYVFSKGAVAVVIRKDAEIKSDKPMLRVDNTKSALKAIGIATANATTAKKVLVTGSFGKTGIKTQLYHLIRDQMNTNAVLNSANKDAPIWRALGAIRKNDEVAIVEVAVPAPGRGKQRARWVSPDICIISAIGLEHVKSHGGTLNHVITNKAEVVKGLPQGGLVIIPDIADLTDKLIKEINKHGDFKILLFGENENCHAQILNKHFNNFDWDIKARIEDQLIEYHLPLLEEYAPHNSLCVLLTAYHLGVDISKSAMQYGDYRQYGSSGNFYQLQNSKGRFYLYDQSKRGELDAFKSTLRLISRMQPNTGGRKIAILSEFTNLDEADISIINVDEFRALIEQAGIDLLYTTHHFSEHINVLPDKSIWKNHKANIEHLIPEILDVINDNDMVFVRGTLMSDLKKMVDAVLNSADVVKRYY